MEIKPRVEPGLPKPRRRWIRVVIAATILLALWGSLATRNVLQARDLALQGLSRLEAIRDRTDLEQLTEGALKTDLEAAAGDFTAANERVRSRWLAPLRVVPWVGTQIRSADALSGSARDVTNALARTSDDASELAETMDAQERDAVAFDVLDLTRRAQAAFADIRLGPEGGLIKSLAEARLRFEREVEEAREMLADAERAAAGIAEFLDGPTTYLLLASNNSEMQAGSGSYLMAGSVRIVNGRLEVDELRATSDIILPSGAVSITDEDLASRWGWLDISSDWRNLSPSPRFSANAELAKAMWKELTGEEVDGVIALDVIALETILAETGPVEIDGRTIDAQGVSRELLFDQYWEDDVEVRRDRLREIAIATLEAADSTGIDLVAVALRLGETADGRHLMAWSDDPTQQEAWRTLGIDGDISADSLSMAVINRGSNKLDTFLVVDAVLTAERSGDDRLMTIDITIQNRAATDFPDYVLGPAVALGNEPGTYEGILSVNVPTSAFDIQIAGEDDLVAAGSDGDSQVVASRVEIGPGGHLERRITFTLPASAETLTIEPSARVPGVEWSAAGRRWIDRGAVIVDLEAGNVSGTVLEQDVGRVSFEPEQIATPVAPLPFARISDDVDTTVVISWPGALVDDLSVDVWERPAGSDWTLVGTTSSSEEISLAGRTRSTEYCYRSALTDSPDQFAPIECVFIPESLGYMRFPGESDSYFVTSDFISGGELDIRVLVLPDAWSPEFWQMFAGQYDSLGNDRAWRFGLDSFNALVANFSADGLVDLGANREVPNTFIGGTPEWVRMTLDPAAGLLQFWTSNNGSVWSKLGEERSFDPVGDLNDSTGPVFVGTDRRSSDNPFAGRLYYLEVRNGINGALLADLDFRSPTQQDGGPQRWVDSEGNIYRANGTGWEYVPPEE